MEVSIWRGKGTWSWSIIGKYIGTCIGQGQGKSEKVKLESAQYVEENDKCVDSNLSVHCVFLVEQNREKIIDNFDRKTAATIWAIVWMSNGPNAHTVHNWWMGISWFDVEDATACIYTASRNGGARRTGATAIRLQAVNAIHGNRLRHRCH